MTSTVVNKSAFCYNVLHDDEHLNEKRHVKEEKRRGREFVMPVITKACLYTIRIENLVLRPNAVWTHFLQHTSGYLKPRENQELLQVIEFLSVLLGTTALVYS